MQLYDSLCSEKHEIERILEQIPPQNVIERISFESRLTRVQEQLTKLDPPVQVKKASLTFRGLPVEGSRAIEADFSSKVTGLFTDAVATIAAGFQDTLKSMGKIPNKKLHQLLITGTAVGSFGFEFEVQAKEKDDELFPSQSAVAKALDRLIHFLEITISGVDEDLAEAVDEIHPRAVKKIAEMLEFTAKEQAWCALSFAGRTFRFRDHQELEKAVERVREDNIRVENAELQGRFTGILPKARQFEFQSQDGELYIKGRVGDDVESLEELKSKIDQPVKVTFDKISVGQGRPKYTISSLQSITCAG